MSSIEKSSENTGKLSSTDSLTGYPGKEEPAIRLADLEKKLRLQGDVMPAAARYDLENQIEDLRAALATPEDKLKELAERLHFFEKQASRFPQDSTEYKIIENSVRQLQEQIQELKSKLTFWEDTPSSASSVDGPAKRTPLLKNDYLFSLQLG